MKEYITTFKQIIQLHWKEFLFHIFFSIGSGIVGIIILLTILITEGSGEVYGELGAMVCLLLSFALIVFGSTVTTQNKFNLSISMGKTRKTFFPVMYLILVLDILIILGIAELTSFLEGIIYSSFYPEAFCVFDATKWLHNPTTFLGMIFGIPIVILLKSILLMKYSAKFYLIQWVFWMFCCFGIPKIITETLSNPTSIIGQIVLAIFNFFRYTPPLVLTAGVAVILLMGLSLTMRLYKKQSVIA